VNDFSLLELDADLYVQYNGKAAMVAVNRSVSYFSIISSFSIHLIDCFTFYPYLFQFLTAYSNYFRNLFTGDWKEKKDLLVNTADGKLVRQIKENSDFNLAAFTFMLNAMHIFGPTPALLKIIPFPRWAEEDRQTKMALLKLAIKYQLWVLEEYAVLALIDMPSSSCTELLELLELADQFVGLGVKPLKVCNQSNNHLFHELSFFNFKGALPSIDRSERVLLGDHQELRHSCSAAKGDAQAIGRQTYGVCTAAATGSDFIGDIFRPEDNGLIYVSRRNKQMIYQCCFHKAISSFLFIKEIENREIFDISILRNIDRFCL
jgi:hypothetical protein